MKAIILSAGQGSRLLPLTAERPKCALPVAGRSVLEWQLEQISQCDIDEVIVVTGFAADTVDLIVRDFRGVPVRTLHNPHFSQYDNLGTCWMARAEMHEPFVLINGDTLFEARILDRLLAADSQYPITLATDHKRDYDSDDMKTTIVGSRLARVSKALDVREVNGESIGMTRFDSEGAALFRTTLSRCIERSDGARLWYLSAIDELAGEGRVGVCRIDGLDWCEIDTREDLHGAQTLVSGWYTPVPSASFRAAAVSGS